MPGTVLVRRSRLARQCPSRHCSSPWITSDLFDVFMVSSFQRRSLAWIANVVGPTRVTLLELPTLPSRETFHHPDDPRPTSRRTRGAARGPLVFHPFQIGRPRSAWKQYW